MALGVPLDLVRAPGRAPDQTADDVPVGDERTRQLGAEQP